MVKIPENLQYQNNLNIEYKCFYFYLENHCQKNILSFFFTKHVLTEKIISMYKNNVFLLKEKLDNVLNTKI